MKGFDLLNIILSVKTSTVLERIKKRGRPMEQGEELQDYFTNLNKHYVPEMVANLINKG
jgi:deoxyadenosine/deoxycytidine kinase